MRFFLCIFLSSLSCFVEGLLPPFYTSLAEYKALLNDERLEKLLGSGEFIREIRRDETGFTITTTKYTLLVDVTYLPTQRIGPGQFKLEFHTPEHIDAK